MALKINKMITPYNHYAGNLGRDWIVIHYVGALGDARANCEFYAGGNRGASAHYYVGFAGDIWQSVEEEDSAWSVGVNYGGELFARCNNRNSLNIEMCVRKKSTRTMNATDKDWYFEDATVKSAVALTKSLMKKYHIPADHVVRHYDVCRKNCPAPYVTNNTKHTWAEFKKLIGEKGDVEVPAVAWYRVGTAWEDGACVGQIGAYEVLQNAVKAAEASDVTMRVYDDKGNCVYTSAEKRPLTGTQARAVTGTEAEKAAKMLELVRRTDESGILWSVTTAQMILESGYCGTDLAQGANNCFGMKASLSGNTWKSVWDGVSTYTKVTAEQDKAGNEYHVTAAFRKYQSVEDSIRDHSLYLIGAMNGSVPRYKGITSARPAKKAIELIKAGGYATDVKYVSKILDIIKRYGLDKYDGECQPAGAPAKPASSGEGTQGQKTPYRVRRTWADSASQVGAYDILENAVRHADRTGYTVYDATGQTVYTAAPTAEGGRVPFMIRVKGTNTEIKRGPGVAYGQVDIFKPGTYTIVETKQSKGHTFGRLLSGAGWVDLAYVERV